MAAKDVLNTGRYFGEIGVAAAQHAGELALGLVRKAGDHLSERDRRDPDLVTQALARCLNDLEFAEVSGFPEMKMTMLMLTARFTAERLDGDGSVLDKPWTDPAVVTRGLEVINEHFPRLEGLDRYSGLSDTQYKALYQGVQHLPAFYEAREEPVM